MTDRREFLRYAAAGVAGAAAIGAAAEAAAASPGYAIPPEPMPTIPIVGSDARFPVRRIYCMGLNYAAHVKEGAAATGFDVPPFYFQKSADMIVPNGATIAYPLLTKNFHYELEMVVALKAGGTNIARESALDCVYGYATGLDMTRRDLQTEAMDKKKPWEPGKSFDQCAPCSAISPAALVGDMGSGRIQLKVNGEVHQDADVAEMILDVPAIIAFISRSVALAPGDIIFTGTPAGVGPVVSGDRMVGTIDKLETLRIAVA